MLLAGDNLECFPFVTMTAIAVKGIAEMSGINLATQWKHMTSNLKPLWKWAGCK